LVAQKLSDGVKLINITNQTSFNQWVRDWETRISESCKNSFW